MVRFELIDEIKNAINDKSKSGFELVSGFALVDELYLYFNKEGEPVEDYSIDIVDFSGVLVFSSLIAAIINCCGRGVDIRMRDNNGKLILDKKTQLDRIMEKDYLFSIVDIDDV